MITRRLLVVSAGLFAAPPAAAAPRDRTPWEIIADIYRRGQTGNHEGAFGLDPKERALYLSQELINLWAKADAKMPAGNAGPIDWDVTTNSQGMEVGSYSVEVVRRQAARFDLIVTLTARTPWFRKSPDENIVRYRFIREDARWVIDDIRRADDAEKDSLKDLLRRAARESSAGEFFRIRYA